MPVILMADTECPTATETEHLVETQPHVPRHRLSAHLSSSVAVTVWHLKAEACRPPQDQLRQKRRRRRVSSRSDSARVEKAVKKQYIRNDLMGRLGGSWVFHSCISAAFGFDPHLEGGGLVLDKGGVRQWHCNNTMILVQMNYF
jgi:hypothetical protein